jgi:uncharacterized protein YjbI with pentapeptide repeats
MFNLMRRLRRLFHLEPVLSLPDVAVRPEEVPDSDPANAEAKRKNVDTLIASINDSAKQASAVILTFLATVIYLAITAGSTTDEQLLLNSPLTLPLFNVGVPTRYFYSIAPALIVFLHLNLLLQEYFVAYRFYRLPEHIRRSRLDISDNTVEPDSLFIIPSVIMRLRRRHNRPVRFLLRLVFISATVVLPVVVLILIQVKFLPYHDRSITTWLHRTPVIIDVAFVILFFFFRPRTHHPDSGKHLIHWGLETVAICALVAMSLLAIGYSVKVATIPDTCVPSRFDKFTGHRNLRFVDRTLAPQGSSFAHGVRLSKRDLRCADFTGSTLSNADFRSSDIRGANFFDAKLQGTDFSPLGTQNRRRSKATLAGIGVTSPLPEEEKDPTRLEDVNFTQAKLQGANFRAAQLARAHLENADLRAADFSFANLDGAKLSGALLFATDFKATSLRSTNFQGAQLQGANLSAAKAEYAVFLGASLEGADLSHVSATGAEFARAFLQGAVGLPLQGLDLHQAKVARTSFCGTRPSYLDLRDLEFAEQPWSDTKALADGLAEIPSEARERLEKAREATLCLGYIVPPQSPNHVLYSRQQLPGWPEPQLDEDSYYGQLSAYLMNRSCASDEPARLAMEERVLERLTVDPEDVLAKKLVRLLRQEILSPTCNPPFDFQGHEGIKKNILRRVDLPR